MKAVFRRPADPRSLSRAFKEDFTEHRGTTLPARYLGLRQDGAKLGAGRHSQQAGAKRLHIQHTVSNAAHKEGKFGKRV